MKKFTWSYGVMTVPLRARKMLPSTLDSLVKAGFDKPRLFVDGVRNADSYNQTRLPVSYRYPALRVVGNWILSMWELYLRDPHADRYVLFQDDILVCSNLRRYLESCPYPEQGFLNCYTVPQNETLQPKGFTGWYPSNQMGRGALALVFDQEALLTLFTQRIMMNGLKATNGWKGVDKWIINSFKSVGWKEYVHLPSLVQHVGVLSMLNNSPKASSETFREDYDPLCKTTSEKS